MKKGLFLLGLAVVMAAPLASCGSTGISDDELVIGMEVNYAPFNWSETTSSDYNLPVSNHSGSYADGYDIQIAKLLGEATGRKVSIYQSKWESLVPSLQAGTINAIIAGMTDTEDRRLSIDFTDEYYHSELVLVTKKSVAEQYTSAITKDAFGAFVDGKMIVSQKGTVTDDVIDQVFTGYGAIRNTPVADFATAALNVSMDGAFAMTAELPVATSIISSFTDLGIVHIDQGILGGLYASLGVSIGIQKGADSLKDSLNAALKNITSDQRLSIMEAALSRSGD